MLTSQTSRYCQKSEKNNDFLVIQSLDMWLQQATHNKKWGFYFCYCMLRTHWNVLNEFSLPPQSVWKITCHWNLAESCLVKTLGLFIEALKETKVHIQVQVHNATACDGRIVQSHGNRDGWMPFAPKQDMPSAEQAPQSNNHVMEGVWHIVHDVQQFGHHSSLRNKLRRFQIHSNDRTYLPNEFI